MAYIPSVLPDKSLTNESELLVLCVQTNYKEHGSLHTGGESELSGR